MQNLLVAQDENNMKAHIGPNGNVMFFIELNK